MAMQFKRAVKSKAKARIGLVGPSGSGKTYTALLLASSLGQRIAVIDTEYGSASKYADEFEFDTLELSDFHPRNYIDGIKAAGAAGYDVLIIDSLSHAWAGPGGALELADRTAAKYSGNRFAAWRDVTPLHNQLIEAMLSSPCHLIATMRSKMEYIQTQDDRGKTVIRKVGMAPIQREGMEYEFDVVGDIDIDHNLIITKTRCKELDGLVINKPGPELAEEIKAWLSDGEEQTEQKPTPALQPAPRIQPAPQQASLLPNNQATQPQIKRIFALAKSLSMDEEALRYEMKGLVNKESFSELTKREASAVIEYLMGMEVAMKSAAAGR